MLVLLQQENEQDQSSVFQGTYFKSFQIHQLAIMYWFEHINHDILINF